MYLALEQGPPFGPLLVVRAVRDPAGLVRPIQSAVRQLDPSTTAFGAVRFESLLADALAGRRYTVLLLSAFGGIAVILAFVGVYATVAHVMRGRQREFAIRMACGATPGAVLGTGLTGALRACVPGLVLGVALAVVSARLLRGLLFGVGPLDPVTFAVVGVGTGAAIVAAGLVPSLRCARLDPARVLRNE